jgi:hypothetical protein
MARTLLRSIAIAAGTGLAIGFGLTFGRRAHPRGVARPDPELSALHASLAGINDRLAAQSREIELLRIRAAEDEKLSASHLQFTERRFQELDAVTAALPAIEDKLLEHSASFADLSYRASQSDANLQKLVNAVERLCDQRAPEPTPAALQPEPSHRPHMALVMFAAAAAFLGTRFTR